MKKIMSIEIKAWKMFNLWTVFDWYCTAVDNKSVIGVKVHVVRLLQQVSC